MGSLCSGTCGARFDVLFHHVPQSRPVENAANEVGGFLLPKVARDGVVMVVVNDL